MGGSEPHGSGLFEKGPCPGAPPAVGWEAPGGRPLEELETFLPYAQACLKHPSERARLAAILTTWTSRWRGKQRVLEYSRSHHGAYLHFNQLMGGKWVQAFTFVATRREGVCLRGPEPDRVRKAHKLRANPLNAAPLDALFEAWSAHPEARPAGHAVEFFVEETPDDVWADCLQSVLTHLGA